MFAESAAEKTFLEALALHRKFRNRKFEGLHLHEFARCLVKSGRLDEARANFLAGAAILRELGDLGGLERKGKEMREACAKAGVPAFE